MEPMPATRVTWRDVLTMPEDGNRYEAIGGELCLSPPPKAPHQWVSARLFAALHELLVRPGHGYLFAARTGRAERYSERLPVWVGSTLVGEIELAKVFDWPR